MSKFSGNLSINVGYVHNLGLLSGVNLTVLGFWKAKLRKLLP